MTLILLGVILLLWARSQQWKRRALAGLVLPSAPTAAPVGPSYRIRYLEGRKLKTMTVLAKTEAEAIAKLVQAGGRFDAIRELVKL